MKVKCIRLLDSDGNDVEDSPWLALGKTYHVMSTYVDAEGRRRFGIVSRHPDGEWPQMINASEKCFEVVSSIIPSNWLKWERAVASGMAPAAWQVPGFFEAFYDHEPETYPIFERERDVILKEDP